MIELVRSGRRPKELSKEFDCHVSSILNWVRQADEMAGAEPAHSAALNANERQELIELRRKLRQVQMERDILAKANHTLTERIREVYVASDETDGMPRIRAEVLDTGLVASRKRIARLMRQATLRGVSRRRGY